jgi:hypothetical protein
MGPGDLPEDARRVRHSDLYVPYGLLYELSSVITALQGIFRRS